jgi:hypothetical protein
MAIEKDEYKYTLFEIGVNVARDPEFPDRWKATAHLFTADSPAGLGTGDLVMKEERHDDDPKVAKRKAHGAVLERAGREIREGKLVT